MPTFEPEKPGMNTAKLWIGLCMAACLYIGCKKNDLSGSPTISLKSVSASVIPYNTDGSLLTFVFSLTEKSYNSGDSLHVIVNIPNCQDTPTVYLYNMTSIGSGIPSTTNGSSFKGDLTVSLSNGSNYELSGGYPDIESDTTCYAGGKVLNDTAYFSFVLGSGTHFSDTVKAGPIVLLHD
jgi:hypothetical protein